MNKFEATINGEPEKRVGDLVGSYRLIRWLGRGAFADIYLGEHLYLKTQSAIKILHVELSEKALKDFLNEARAIAQLEHPHIVSVLDYGEENGIPFLVMTYAANGSLRQRVPSGKRVSLEQIVPLVQQMASALDYAHQQKLIHRDVKPENMLVGAQDQVLLSDFGFVLVTQG
ncbi:MAG TPA: serine/threonine-protein kinase, partial [Ktedonobacteraceae bacterium]|nr:serine/threonine-protein kinase [Ktedonobacteraceae bacterium]